MKWKKGTQLERKPKKRNNLSIKCIKQKGRENLLDVLQRFWLKLKELNETSRGEHKGVAFEKVLNLSVLNGCKWSVVS